MPAQFLKISSSPPICIIVFIFAAVYFWCFPIFFETSWFIFFLEYTCMGLDFVLFTDFYSILCLNDEGFLGKVAGAHFQTYGFFKHLLPEAPVVLSCCFNSVISIWFSCEPFSFVREY